MNLGFFPRTPVSTVTRIAVIYRTRIVNPGPAHEGCGSMTTAAIQAGGQVGRIGLGILTRCRHTMTGIATRCSSYCTVIEGCRKETRGVMTDATILTRQYMAINFTLGECTVMAGLAVINDANMIKGPRDKTRGEVTNTAIVAGWHMGTMLSFGGHTIVAGRTVTHDPGVIILSTSKGRGVMANRAILRGREMIAWFNRGGCHTTLVAR